MQLVQKTLHAPMNANSIRLVRGRIERIVSKQGAAATLTENEILDGSGNLQELYLVAAAVAASGESLTINVLKNGVSILTAPFVYDSPDPSDTVISLPVLPDVSFVLGDVITVARTYVAGGGPTPIGANKVVLEYA